MTLYHKKGNTSTHGWKASENFHPVAEHPNKTEGREFLNLENGTCGNCDGVAEQDGTYGDENPTIELEVSFFEAKEIINALVETERNEISHKVDDQVPFADEEVAEGDA